MAAASRRCRSTSCSRKAACCFLLPREPKSPDLVRRSKRPKLERRGGLDFPASGIGASLSADGGDAVPALGVRGLLDETMLIGYELVAEVTGNDAVSREKWICLN